MEWGRLVPAPANERPRCLSPPISVLTPSSTVTRWVPAPSSLPSLLPELGGGFQCWRLSSHCPQKPLSTFHHSVTFL